MSLEALETKRDMRLSQDDGCVGKVCARHKNCNKIGFCSKALGEILNEKISSEYMPGLETRALDLCPCTVAYRLCHLRPTRPSLGLSLLTVIQGAVHLPSCDEN